MTYFMLNVNRLKLNMTRNGTVEDPEFQVKNHDQEVLAKVFLQVSDGDEGDSVDWVVSTDRLEELMVCDSFMEAVKMAFHEAVDYICADAAKEIEQMRKLV